MTFSGGNKRTKNLVSDAELHIFVGYQHQLEIIHHRLKNDNDESTARQPLRCNFGGSSREY